MKKLFIDIDATIINSISAFCEVYNNLYQYLPGFKPAWWWEAEKWDLKDIAPLVNNCNDIFGCKDFFEICDFINDNTLDVLEKLNEKYKIVLCSLGVPSNISYKALWIEKKLPFIKDYILMVNNGCKMNKSLINMQDSNFIDDVASNLDSSNAELKICFGDTYAWNIEWEGIRCANWTDIRNLLL